MAWLNVDIGFDAVTLKPRFCTSHRADEHELPFEHCFLCSSWYTAYYAINLFKSIRSKAKLGLFSEFTGTIMTTYQARWKLSNAAEVKMIYVIAKVHLYYAVSCAYLDTLGVYDPYTNFHGDRSVRKNPTVWYWPCVSTSYWRLQSHLRQAHYFASIRNFHPTQTLLFEE